jgi:hypothetical protein
VTVPLATSNDECGLVVGQVVLDAANWDTGIGVTVGAVDDDVAEGVHTCVVETGAAASDDANYAGLDPADVTVTIVDNDTAGVALVPLSVSVSEDGVTDTYEVVLQTEPAHAVTVSITTDGQTTVHPTHLIFTPADWDAPQAVAVAAIHDHVPEGTPHTGVISHTAASADLHYHAITIDVMTTVITDFHQIFLPLVLNDYVIAPDLVVEEIVATPGGVQVTVKNQGNAPTGADGFWVDVYVDPAPAPTATNQMWNDLAEQGMVWGVEESLAPGKALTLTVNGPYYKADYSDVSWPLALGTPVYAQVDSVHPDTDYGAVREMDEIRGGSYNNILSTTVEAGTLPQALDGSSRSKPGRLPPR